MDETSKRLERVENVLTGLRTDVTRLSTLVENQAMNCPYRELIAKAANHIDDIDDLREKINTKTSKEATRRISDEVVKLGDCVTSIKLEVVKLSTKSGLTGGLTGATVVSIIGGIVVIILKSKGWL